MTARVNGSGIARTSGKSAKGRPTRVPTLAGSIAEIYDRPTLPQDEVDAARAYLREHTSYEDEAIDAMSDELAVKEARAEQVWAHPIDLGKGNASNVNIIKPFKPYVTHVLPRHASDPDCNFKHDPKGRAIIENAHQERVTAKRTGLEWD